jgi:hypothetical protein
MSAGTRNKASAAAGLALLLLGATGCAPEFAEVSEIETLRVLGVKKDKPYAAPGEEVTLSMLWSDGSPDAGRPIKRAWLAGVCTNPVGDSFVGCFQAASELFAGEGGEGGPAEIPDGPIDLTPFLPEGDTVTFTIPEDIISERAGSLPPGQVPYGLSMVFFFACAGERFVLDPSARSLFPIICEDADGNALGPDDYVAGYSSIYAYEDIRNDNPIVSAFCSTVRRSSPTASAKRASGSRSPRRTATSPARRVCRCAKTTGTIRAPSTKLSRSSTALAPSRTRWRKWRTAATSRSSSGSTTTWTAAVASAPTSSS